MLTDEEIADLLHERKPLRRKLITKLLAPEPVDRCRDLRAVIQCRGETGRRFIVAAYRTPSPHNPHKFSVHVKYRPAARSKPIVLVRCNGWHGPHPNVIERKLGDGIQRIAENTFHIHAITERYQRALKPDGYAEATCEYNSFESAVVFACTHYGFVITDAPGGEPFPLLRGHL